MRDNLHATGKLAHQLCEGLCLKGGLCGEHAYFSGRRGRAADFNAGHYTYKGNIVCCPQVLESDTGGSIARAYHQLRALLDEESRRVQRQLPHLLFRAVAVGKVRAVGVVDEGLSGK